MRQLFLISLLTGIILYSQTAFAADIVKEIRSTPMGAEVFLGQEEKYVGQTPISIKLPIGVAYITLRKEGFYDAMVGAEISDKNLEPIEILLHKKESIKPDNSNVRINDNKSFNIEIVTVPNDVEVYIGEKETYAGLTPLTINLLKGSTPILLKCNGYNDWKAVVEIEKEMNEPLFIKMIPKVKRTGSKE